MLHFHNLLEGTAAETREAIRTAAIARDYARGADLMRSGDAVTHIFHIRRGRGRIWRPMIDGHSVTLAYVSRHAVPGIVPCFLHQRAASMLTAATAVSAELWPSSLVRQLAICDPIFARNALAMVSTYALLLSDKIEDGVGPVPRRIGRALLRLSDQLSERGAHDPAEIHISRQELADLTGTTLFSVSRTLSEWQRDGIVESARELVTVTNPKKIASIAQLAA